MRVFDRFAALVLLAAVAGCATVGGGADAGPTFPELSGEWSGSVTIGGQQIPSTLEITQEGADLQLLTRVPDLGLITRGEGSVLPDGRMRGSFSYNLECPGDADLVGSLTSDGTVLSGTLLASDCTGDLEGTFTYRRRAEPTRSS